MRRKTRKLTEGQKMFVSVMIFFMFYVVIFIIFDDFDRNRTWPLFETNDWHILGLSVGMMIVLAVLLLRYAKSMDKRITEDQIAKEATLRRQLTQNISHELKTPVTSIMGFLETMIDNPQMENEKRTQFIERAYSQSQHLTALLQDLSILNRMDYAADVLTMETVNISELVAEIGEETALAIEKHNMEWRNCLPENVLVNGNRPLIYSIFRNLVDNAINYAGNGTFIEISANEHNKKWEFEVSDNGPGVPDEHLIRIFERFYRVNKGRSRTLGGTGLGLAIVKNAVLLHGGIISAEPKLPRGIKFKFALKK